MSEINEAIRWASINLECYFHEGKSLSPMEVEALSEKDKAALFDSWYCKKTDPIWRRRKPILTHQKGEVFTTAQLLAVHGNLHCKAQCEDADDLIRCVQLTGSYNEFDAYRVAEEFEHFDLRRYYTNNNPNTGSGAFEYEYGWECSTVVYITANFLHRLLVMDRKWEHFTECDPDTFDFLCQNLGRKTKADEIMKVEAADPSDIHKSPVTTWRLWWD